MKTTIALIVTGLALLLSGSAIAGNPQGDNDYKHHKKHHHHPKPVAGQICTDNGTTRTVPDVDAFLSEFPHATRGACVVVIPPVDTPPVVVVPPVVVFVPPVPGNTFLCISHFAGTLPSVVLWSDVVAWLAEGDFVPHAVLGEVPGQDNLSGYHLTCNDGTAKSTGTGIGDGVVYDKAAWASILATYGSVHPNFYEIVS